MLEHDSEDDHDVSSEASLIKEHERLAAKYNNERALLEEALKSSQEETASELKAISTVQEENIEEEEAEDEEEDQGARMQVKGKENEKVKLERKHRTTVKAVPLGPISIGESTSEEQDV